MSMFKRFRVTTCCFDSMARSNPGSTKPGNRVILSWWSRKENDELRRKKYERLKEIRHSIVRHSTFVNRLWSLISKGEPMRKNRLANKSIFITFVILAALLVCPVTVFAAEQATEKAVEKAVEKAAEKAAEKAVEKVTEKAVEKALKKASEKPLKQEERPEKWRGPTKINFLVYVADIDNIDGANQSFSANFYVGMRWHDKRLAEDTESIRKLPLDKVWNPRILIINQGGKLWESLPEVVEVTPDGTVTYRQRYVGSLSQPLTLSNFPMDEHLFTIQFVAVGYADGDLEFVPDVIADVSGGAIYKQLSLPDWEIVKFEVVPRPYKALKGHHNAGFAAEFTARRYFPYYLWQVIAPLFLIVMMSCTVFWIDLSNASSRIGVATSAIFTLIAFRFVLAGLLPRLPYMTRMDYFTLGSTLLVFLALVEVILASALANGSYDRMAHTIDKYARFAFPILFLLLFGWFLSGLWKYC